MKKLIAHILIFGLLTTQSAWAMFGSSLDADSQHADREQSTQLDVSTYVTSGSSYKASIAKAVTKAERSLHTHDASPDNVPDSITDSCDHFCHGSVHLQGLSSDSRISFQSIPAVFERILVVIKHSLSEQPVNPPPIS